MAAETEIRIVVCGAAGRMGREVVRAVSEAADMRVVAVVDQQEVGADAGTLAGMESLGVSIESDLEEALERAQPEVLVDFTAPNSVMENVRAALKRNVSPVVGTTGLTAANIAEIGRVARIQSTGAFVAPNFAIGAVLIMQFAAQAARYLPDVEIIEMHHPNKKDSPSGTALLAAQRIAQARKEAQVIPEPPPANLVETVSGARGARSINTGDIPIHSVRLPGLVAHHEILFGGPGQLLTLRHDSTDRRSFMPGVLLAIRKVRSLEGLVVGLENLLYMPSPGVPPVFI